MDPTRDRDDERYFTPEEDSFSSGEGSEEAEGESGSEEETESGSTSEGEGEEEEEEEDDEPVFKYRRFAKEMLASICEGSDGALAKNIITCMTVHPKVTASGVGFIVL